MSELLQADLGKSEDRTFNGNADQVHHELNLYRVSYKNSVSTLIAAHSYQQASAELLRVWPNRKLAYVWSHAGPATYQNHKTWESEVINAKALPPKLTV